MNFTFDFWTVWGLVAQGLFFSRFIIQWLATEKKGQVTIPILFWYLSVFGAVMIIIYALARKDLVFLITGILQIFLYSRSLYIANARK